METVAMMHILEMSEQAKQRQSPGHGPMGRWLEFQRSANFEKKMMEESPVWMLKLFRERLRKWKEKESYTASAELDNPSLDSQNSYVTHNKQIIFFYNLARAVMELCIGHHEMSFKEPTPVKYL